MEPSQSPVEVLSNLDSKRAQVNNYFQDRVMQDLDILYTRLFQLAEGVYCITKRPDGSLVQTFKEKPDMRALAYLWDRAGGKPITTQDDATLRAASSGFISIQQIVKRLVDGNPSLPSTTSDAAFTAPAPSREREGASSVNVSE